jgi:hypothetical protein
MYREIPMKRQLRRLAKNHRTKRLVVVRPSSEFAFFEESPLHLRSRLPLVVSGGIHLSPPP